MAGSRRPPLLPFASFRSHILFVSYILFDYSMLYSFRFLCSVYSFRIFLYSFRIFFSFLTFCSIIACSIKLFGVAGNRRAPRLPFAGPEQGEPQSWIPDMSPYVDTRCIIFPRKLTMGNGGTSVCPDPVWKLSR